jgi:raffinose/stachyose/melibiose transport system substrate-binding protein
MRNTRKILALLIAVIVLAATVGCGGDAATKTDPTSTAPSTSAESTAAAAITPEPVKELEGTITVNMPTGPGLTEGWTAAAQGYMDKHPKVKVVIDLKPGEGYGDWVKSQLSNASPTADLIGGNQAGSALDGKAINWLEYVNNKSPYSEGAWKDQFNFDLQTQNVAKQRLDTISLESVQVLWFYNKAIFEKVGVQPPTTWKELIAVCETIQKAGIQPLAVPGSYDSFWGMQMGWLTQIYADQTTRSMINTYGAKEGDFCYDPDVDGKWTYDVTNPHNDDTWVVNSNEVRAINAIKDGTFKPDSDGMKTVMSQLNEVFPKYAGGNAFFGIKDPAHISMFLTGKAAMIINGGWFFPEFKHAMDNLAGGKEIKSGETKIEGVQKFEMGSFNNPSMEGAGIEATARTIEVALGFISGVKKDKAHDDLVADFMMYYSSKEGFGKYMAAGLTAGWNPAGPALVYDVELPAEYTSLFSEVKFVGNGQKGFGNMLARGAKSNKGDIDTSYREWYKYTQDFFTGKIDVNKWATLHKANFIKYLPEMMKNSGISENDLKNPQTAPSGK